MAREEHQSHMYSVSEPGSEEHGREEAERRQRGEVEKEMLG